jgi:Transposase and inactivated derivatives
VRFRLYPTPAQEKALLEHCAHARFVWNLALEQATWYRPQWGPTPGYVVQSAQLTEARAASGWLASGSFTVQQQALRDFAQSMRNFWAGTHGHPTWRRRGTHEGFRIVAVRPHHARRINRRWGDVFVPKVGRVRFRWTRAAGNVKSYRITLDRAGRWHVAFAQLPRPLDRQPTGAAVGIDRGVANTLATSDGEFLHAPVMTATERGRHARLQRQMARQQKGSTRRERTQHRIAQLRAQEADRVKDWVEKTTTRLVLGHDLIAMETLAVGHMTRSARGTLASPGRNVRAKTGLNREILARRWGLFARRLNDKAALAGVVVVEVPAAYTSQRCSACGHVAIESRESQATFRCITCGHIEHADTNAARNILAAGRAVTARGGEPSSPSNREPQPRSLQAA